VRSRAQRMIVADQLIQRAQIGFVLELRDAISKGFSSSCSVVSRCWPSISVRVSICPGGTGRRS
jgi:hypothetical protein